MKVHDIIASSGLSDSDAKTLKLKLLSEQETKKITGKYSVPSVKIPYFDTSGKVIPDYFRLRFVEIPKVFGQDQCGKYWQSPGTSPEAYYPPYFDWSEIATEPAYSVVITEGEKKAASCCKIAEYPTIGLGGVSSWRSKKKLLPLLKSLQLFEWNSRVVYIVFDSDLSTNVDVQKALNALAGELGSRGAVPHIVYLPSSEDSGKTGLDDFLVEKGVSEFTELVEASQPHAATEALISMNEKYCFIEDTAMVVRFEDGGMWSADKFKNSVASNLRYKKMRGEKLVDANLAADWVDWPNRMTARKLAYRPGEERFVDGALNRWYPSDVVPKRANTEPFQLLLDVIFGDNRQSEERRWFLCWAAYQLKYPGTKLHTACVIIGHEQGTGKTLLATSIGKLFGRNFSVVTQFELESQYTGWVQEKQFVLGEEITGSNKRQQSDRLKHLITSPSLIVNEKFVPAFELDNKANFIFISNHINAFIIEPSDRRLFVVEVVGTKRGSSFYDEYADWYDNQGGQAAVLHYLLHYDTGGFNPNHAAYRTEAKSEIIEEHISPLQTWISKMKHDPDAFLRIRGQPSKSDLFTIDQITKMIDPGGEHERFINATAVSNALRQHAFYKIPQQIPHGGKRLRLWALRNMKYWKDTFKFSKASANRRAKVHFDKHNPFTAKDKA